MHVQRKHIKHRRKIQQKSFTTKTFRRITTVGALVLTFGTRSVPYSSTLCVFSELLAP
jgi:hypothetical protein